MNKQTILNIGLIVALAIVISMLFKPNKFKGVVKEKEKRIEQLEKYISTVEKARDTLELKIVQLEDSVKKRDVQLIAKTAEVEKEKRKSDNRVREIQQLSKSEADSLLEKKYPDTNLRSKNILSDLEYGERNERLLEIEAQRVGLLNQKVSDLEEIIINKDEVISNLEMQLSAHEKITQEREDQVKLLKKEVRRQKRQKIATGIAGGAAVVLVLLAK